MTTATIASFDELVGTGSIDTLEISLGGIDNFWGTIVDASLRVAKYTPNPTEDNPNPAEQYQRKLQIDMQADAGWPTTLEFNLPTDKDTGEPELVEKSVDGRTVFVPKAPSANSNWGLFASKLAAIGVPPFKTASDLRGLHVRIMKNTLPGYKGGAPRDIRLPMETDGFNNDVRSTVGLPPAEVTVNKGTVEHEKSVDDLVGKSWIEYKSFAEKNQFSEQYTRGDVTKLIQSGILVEVDGKYARA